MEQNTFTIFRGDNKTMSLKVINQGCSGDPLDLTDCTAIDVALQNEDGTFSHLTLEDDAVEITDPPILGKFTADIDEEVSAGLLVGELQNIDVTFTIASKPVTVRFFNALTVLQRN